MKYMEGNILVAVAEALPARRSALRRPRRESSSGRNAGRRNRCRPKAIVSGIITILATYFKYRKKVMNLRDIKIGHKDL